MHEEDRKKRITIEIDEETLKSAVSNLARHGMEVSDAVNTYLERIAYSGARDGMDAGFTQEVINSSPLFIIRLKGREGNYRVTYANEKLLQFTPNKSLSDIQAHYDRSGLGIHLMDKESDDVSGIISSLTYVGQTNIAEGRLQTPDGGEMWMRCMCICLQQKRCFNKKRRRRV